MNEMEESTQSVSLGRVAMLVTGVQNCGLKSSSTSFGPWSCWLLLMMYNWVLGLLQIVRDRRILATCVLVFDCR